MGKYLMLLIIALTFACKKAENRPEPVVESSKIIVVDEMKEISRGKYNPDLYIISTKREAIDMFYHRDDFARIRVGDTIKITYFDGFIDSITILNNK